MMKALVVSPHPDDETLGAGGTIRRLVTEGHQVAWLNITNLKEDYTPPPVYIRAYCGAGCGNSSDKKRARLFRPLRPCPSSCWIGGIREAGHHWANERSVRRGSARDRISALRLRRTFGSQDCF